MAIVPAGDLYNYLRGQFADSGLVGYVPPDGASFGITNGSADEWARFGLAVAKQESDLNSRSYNPSDPGGSLGLFQFGQGQTQFTQGQNQFDPENSANAFVRSVQHYVGNGGTISNLGGTFGSIRRPNETLQHMDWATKVASQQGGPGGFQPSGQSALAAAAPGVAQAPTTTGIDPVLAQRMQELQAAMALYNRSATAPALAQATTPPTGAPAAAPGYAGLNLSAMGGMGGGNIMALANAIRQQRAMQALRIQNAANFGGQLAQGGLQAYGNFLQQNPGGMIDPFASSGSLAFG